MEKRFSKYVGDNGAAIPSVLHAADFFMARASSGVNLYTSLKLKSRIIPRHLRRRMRSFKPFHDRPLMRKSPVYFPTTLSRRTRRKRGMYLDPERFLPTHVWHAKRFKMENLWGKRIAVSVRNKGERAILRIAKHNCCIHDRSYMDCWKFEGSNVLDKLHEIGIAGMVAHPKVRSGNFFGNGFINRDKIIVSPYQALWRDDTLYIWTHPAARPEVDEILSTVEHEKMARSLRFELTGSRSKETLAQITGIPLVSAPGQVGETENGLILNLRANGSIIDIFLPETCDAPKSFRQLVFAGASPIGVLDRHKLFANFGAPDFPFDFPVSKAGSRQSAMAAKTLLEQEKRKPPQRRMNPGNIESPFFPDWTVLGLHKVPETDSLKPCWIHATRGTVKANAHIYRAGILIGYVSTSTCGSSSAGIGSVSASTEMIGSVHITFRNPGSDHHSPGVIHGCACKSTDSSLLGIKVVR